MHNTSRIIQKNLFQLSPCPSGLWINPEKDEVWREAVPGVPGLRLFCQDHGAYRFHQQAGADVEFSAFPAKPKQTYQWIVLSLPRQKALLGMLLACAATLLAKGGSLWLAGENKAGIKSADKLLKTHFGTVRKLDNARHCTLYEAKNPLQQQCFAAQDFREQWPLSCQGSELQICSYPGVFAHGRLDRGTALLLDAVAGMDIDGDVLDFGCGAGVIGACIGNTNEHARVTFLDSNALALLACEDTLSRNGLSGSVLASDGLTEVHNSYDLVITNPPIHTGVTTDTHLSIKLLARVHEHIKPGGQLIMVANRHLPYERWLAQNFAKLSELSNNDHFKIISAQQ